MGLQLDVDGEIISEPSSEQIAEAFDAIPKIKGFSKGISIVSLTKDPEHSLSASGHPVEGWFHLVIQDWPVEFVSFQKQPLPQQRVIGIFQAYARGEMRWRDEFHWDGEKTKEPGMLSRAFDLLLRSLFRGIWGTLAFVAVIIMIAVARKLIS